MMLATQVRGASMKIGKTDRWGSLAQFYDAETSSQRSVRSRIVAMPGYPVQDIPPDKTQIVPFRSAFLWSTLWFTSKIIP